MEKLHDTKAGQALEAEGGRKDVELIFVYGTLKKGFSNHNRFLSKAVPFNFHIGTLHGHDMYSLGRFPGVVAGLGSVKGELYHVTAEEIEQMDYLEGYRPTNEKGSLYVRRKVHVMVEDGSIHHAWVYLFNRSIEGLTKVESGNWSIK